MKCHEAMDCDEQYAAVISSVISVLLGRLSSAGEEAQRAFDKIINTLVAVPIPQQYGQDQRLAGAHAVRESVFKTLARFGKGQGFLRVIQTHALVGLIMPLDSYGYNALHNALRQPSGLLVLTAILSAPEFLSFLTAGSCKPIDARNDAGLTPLLAVLHYHGELRHVVEAVRALLRAGADVNARTAPKPRAVLAASGKGWDFFLDAGRHSLDVCTALIEHGARCDHCDARTVQVQFELAHAIAAMLGGGVGEGAPMKDHSHYPQLRAALENSACFDGVITAPLREQLDELGRGRCDALLGVLLDGPVSVDSRIGGVMTLCAQQHITHNNDKSYHGESLPLLPRAAGSTAPPRRMPPAPPSCCWTRTRAS